MKWQLPLRIALVALIPGVACAEGVFRFEAANAQIFAIQANNQQTALGPAAVMLDFSLNPGGTFHYSPNFTDGLDIFQSLHTRIETPNGLLYSGTAICRFCDVQFIRSPPILIYQSGGDVQDANDPMPVDSGKFGLDSGVDFTPSEYFWGQFTPDPGVQDPNGVGGFIVPGQTIPNGANHPAEQLLNQLDATWVPGQPSILDYVFTLRPLDPNVASVPPAAGDVVRISIRGPITGISVIPLPAALPLLGAAFIGLGYLFRHRH